MLMVGGYLTFSGIDAKARWGARCCRRRSRCTSWTATTASSCRQARPHGGRGAQIVDGLDHHWPALLGMNEVVPGQRQVTGDLRGHPLLVVCRARAGRTAAFTSDLAPHRATPAFLAWTGTPPVRPARPLARIVMSVIC